MIPVGLTRPGTAKLVATADERGAAETAEEERGTMGFMDREEEGGLKREEETAVVGTGSSS